LEKNIRNGKKPVLGKLGGEKKGNPLVDGGRGTFGPAGENGSLYKPEGRASGGRGIPRIRNSRPRIRRGKRKRENGSCFLKVKTGQCFHGEKGKKSSHKGMPPSNPRERKKRKFLCQDQGRVKPGGAVVLGKKKSPIVTGKKKM